MRICRVAVGDELHYGVLEGEAVALLSSHPFGPFEPEGRVLPLTDVRLVAPVLPSKVIASWPEDGFFRGPDGTLLSSPLIKGVVGMLFITAGAMGLAYGFVTGTYKNDGDVVDGMSKSMKSLGTYMVLVFFAAQFVAYFKWSNNPSSAYRNSDKKRQN